MTITAKIIADSISLHGKRLTTLQLRYPKFIHGEFMTHRVFSRNASSSRAIPVERLIVDVQRDRVDPPIWFKNKPGMQGSEPFTGQELDEVQLAWDVARSEAIRMAVILNKLGAHKQHVNRVLEPYSHINVVVTATEWSNFFALRCHPDAQPEIRELAEKMREARDNSSPQHLHEHEWHTPYVDRHEYAGEAWQHMIKLSVARCARVSYTTHDGAKPDIERDLALYNQLVSAVPLHVSPAEHQAKPDVITDDSKWRNPWLHANFVGWLQYRKTLPGESQ